MVADYKIGFLLVTGAPEDVKPDSLADPLADSLACRSQPSSFGGYSDSLADIIPEH